MKIYLILLCLIGSFSVYGDDSSLDEMIKKRDQLEKSSEELNREIAVKLLDSLNLRQKNIQRKMEVASSKAKEIERARLKKKRQHVPRIFKEQADITAKFFPEELDK